jgi:hypothetical protein
MTNSDPGKAERIARMRKQLSLHIAPRSFSLKGPSSARHGAHAIAAEPRCHKSPIAMLSGQVSARDISSSGRR